MNYRCLGNTGLKVSELCMGTMTFGREATEPVCYEILDRFANSGGNFIDTANIYGAGAAETIIGRWLKGKRRHDYVIATKSRFATGDGPNDVGLSRKYLLDQVETSLRHLGTDYIDLYQVHCWDAATPLEETLSTLNDLVRAGKVRYLGASNFMGWQLQKAIDISRQRGWEAFVSLQPQYSLLCRSVEWEIIPVCLNEGLGMVTWSPLRGGWLSGKYHRGMAQPPEGSRAEVGERKGWGEAWSRYSNDFTWQVVDSLLAVAKETGKTPAQVAINWVLQRPGVTAPIIGAWAVEHLDNLGAAGWSLSAEQMAQLNQASEPDVPYYPYVFMRNAELRHSWQATTQSIRP